MAFVNLSLLFGGLLVTIPIVLHLILRQQPKHLIFPALRFIRQRSESNRRQLKLRHWLLLFLRCAAIGLLAFALARPSVRSEALGSWIMVICLTGALVLVLMLIVIAVVYRQSRSLIGALSVVAIGLVVAMLAVMVSTVGHPAGAGIGDQTAPVVAALVLDTAPRLEYRHENHTRLEQARETAVWLIKQLPPDSEIAIVDSRGAGHGFAADLGAAIKTVQRIKPAYAAMPLTDGLVSALELVENSDQQRKEIYIFTDRTEAAWGGQPPPALRRHLDSQPDVQIYVIDVGIDNPRNFGLGDVRLSGQTLGPDSTLRVQTELLHLGEGGNRPVELYLEDPAADQPIIVDGKLVQPEARRADRMLAKVATDGTQTIEFQPRIGQAGTHYGHIRIVGDDGLDVDDIRYFTIEVKPAMPLLVAAGPGANTRLFTEAVAPMEFRASGRSQFGCTPIDLKQLQDQKLEQFDAVCLLDPAPLDEATWQTLADYVREGGGLAIYLGRNARPIDSFNSEAAQQLLPGRLVRTWRAGGQSWYVVPRADHPVFAGFRSIETSIPWYAFPIVKHWELGDLAEGTNVVAEVGENLELIVERSVGDGTVLTMTTPVTDPANRPGRDPWNRLPSGLNPWPCFMLANEMMLHLVDRGEGRLNYLAGEAASLRDRADDGTDQYLVFTPQGGWEEIRGVDGRITVRFTDLPGPYRLISKDGVTRRGFSVNLPPDATRLQRSPRQRLDEVLGKGRYRYARHREEIVRDQGEARVGRQFYPLIVAMLALILGLEHTLANRFYGRHNKKQTA